MDMIDMRIVGGALGGFLTWYLLYLGIRRALSKETSGELYFGGFLLAITLASTIFTLLMLWVLVFVDHGGQYLPLSLMIGFFGLSSVGLWAEQIWTRGFIDDRGFGFQSPAALATPKSMSLTSPSNDTRMLGGLTSR